MNSSLELREFLSGQGNVRENVISPVVCGHEISSLFHKTDGQRSKEENLLTSQFSWLAILRILKYWLEVACLFVFVIGMFYQIRHLQDSRYRILLAGFQIPDFVLVSSSCFSHFLSYFHAFFCQIFIARFQISEIAGFGKTLPDYPAPPECGTSLICNIIRCMGIA